MGLIKRLRDATRRSKAVEVKQELANQLFVNPLCSDYENVFAQVTPLVNEMILVRPFGVGKNGGVLSPTRTPELVLLNKPNEAFTDWTDFAGTMFRTWLTEDELDIHVHMQNSKAIGYSILPPGSKVYEGNGNYYFQCNTTDGIEKLTRDEVMELRFSRSPKNLQRGISPATSIRAWAQTEDVLAQYERAYIENGAIPASITFIRASTQDKYNSVRKELETNLRGARNHGKTIYVWRQFNDDTGESLDQVEVKTIQGNNSTLAIKELSDIINDHLNKAFGVSNFILGDDSSAKYDNAELSDYQFIKRRVYPALTAFWGQFQGELDRITGGLGYAIQFEIELPDLTERQKVRAETAKIRTETLKTLVEAGAPPLAAVSALDLDEKWQSVARGIYQRTLADVAIEKINILSKNNSSHTKNIYTPKCSHCTSQANGSIARLHSASVTQNDLPEMNADEKHIYEVLLSMAERIFADTPNIQIDEVIDEIAETLNRRAELGATDGGEAITKLLKDQAVVAEIKKELSNLQLSGTLKDRIKSRTSDLVNNYGDETKRLMDDVLANSEGKTAAEIRKALREVMPTWQAERIARTETVYAFQSGRLDEDKKIANKYGLSMKLKWHARPGACDVCAAMDGEVTDLGKSFAESVRAGDKLTDEQLEHYGLKADDILTCHHSAWNDHGQVPNAHPNCRCYFDEIVETE